MTYAALADMVARYGELEMVQLTDTTNVPPTTIDAARVDVKLGDAQAFVDGYIGQVYRMPLQGCLKPALPGLPPQYATPPVLTRIVCDVARYYLHDDLAPENEVYRRYKAALKELEALASGVSMLSCPWGGSPGELVGADALQGNGVTYGFSPRQITDDTTRGYA